MSICRFAWDGSDVYLYYAEDGITCCGCRIMEHFVCGGPEEMIAHLAEHRRAGHYVPEDAILTLWEDIPGASAPKLGGGEPKGLTLSRLQLDLARIQVEIDKMEKEGPT